MKLSFAAPFHFVCLGYFSFTSAFHIGCLSGVLSEHRVFVHGGGGEGLQPRTGRRLQECHGDKVRKMALRQGKATCQDLINDIMKNIKLLKRYE